MSSNLIAVSYSEGIEDAWAKVATFVPKFIGFLIVLIVGYFVAKAIGKVFDTVLERVGFAQVERAQHPKHPAAPCMLDDAFDRQHSSHRSASGHVIGANHAAVL